MSGEIRVSNEATSATASLLRQGVSDYCAFGLGNLSPSAPASGSSFHDGALTSALRSALSAFENVMESDVSTVTGIGATIQSADAQVASSMYGR